MFISLGGGDDRLTVTARNAYGRTLPLVLIADGRGDDRIFGGRVNEAVFSGPGNDRMDLGLGSDSYMAGSAPDGDDRVDGGGGVNSVSYGLRTGPVTLDLKAGFGGGGAERDELDDIRAASGGEGDDLLLGGGAANSLDGGLGDDVIRSGAGDDYLDGIGGIDEFSAGGGRDFVWSRDGRTETVGCGAHRDGVYADADDVLIGCEREVGRAHSPFSALAPPPGFERAVRQDSPTPGRWLRAVASRSRLAR